MKIVLDKVATDILTARAVAAFKRLGDVANKIGDAADTVKQAADAAKARPSMRNASAWAWSELLDRVFRR